MIHRLLLLLALLPVLLPASATTPSYELHGRVIDRLSRQGVAYASIVVAGRPQQGTATDSVGRFSLSGVEPGIRRLQISSVGYRTQLSAEYIVSASTPFIEIELEEDPAQISAVTVTPSPFRQSVESPVSLRVIGLKEIEKSPGANRDVSRIVRSYPGVAFSPVGYRNDLIVRGGGPSENRFYLDGIEIPNINHFATQGATGGPVSIINADLVREIGFYTGAFPVDRGGAMSSVLDIRLRDGDAEKQRFKATLGASEVSLSGSGHFGKKTTYLFSIRQSYLQLLFKMLGMPFLPNYIDGQIKVKTRLTDRDELTFLGLFGIDRMRLNTDEKGEEAEYLLSYLPRIEQETFTLGACYRHYAGHHVQQLIVSHNFLNNRELKYRNNDSSDEANLILRLRGVEQKSSIRFENRSYWGRWTVRSGAELSYSNYTNRTLRASYTDAAQRIDYRTDLGIVGWGIYTGAEYASADKRFTAAVGLRADGCDYSSRTLRFREWLSPRASLSYAVAEDWSLSASAGLYRQLPPFTALGFRTDEGKLANCSLGYQRVASVSGGISWRHKDRWVISAEGFYKDYGRLPLSVADQIPLGCKGSDYGAIGDELLVATAEGDAYGVEAMARWQVPGRVNLVGSVTLYRSRFRSHADAEPVLAAWDNRFIVNLSGTFDLPREWSIGARLSCIGGSPYTPYDVEKSSLVEAWNAQGKPYLDYSHYNTRRLDAFAQLDLRIDKNYYFRHWMLGLYIDLQNVTSSQLQRESVLLSTGVIENPDAPAAEQRYVMKRLKQQSGSLIPTLGITIGF